MEVLPDGSFIGHARLGKFYGLTIVEYPVQGYIKPRLAREPVPIKGMRLIDESKYTGPKLRELRKERGVGNSRKRVACTTCMDTGHHMGSRLYPSGHAEVEVHCTDCAPEKLRGELY